MKITAEVSIPVDEKRNVWMTAYAEDVEPEQVAEVAAGLQEALTDQALAAYSVIGTREQRGAAIARAAAAASDVPPSMRPRRPEDPESMRTFGEDGDNGAN